MADKGRLYTDLYNAFKSAYPDKNARQLQLETNACWNEMKTKSDVTDLVKRKISELANVRLKHSGNLLTFWSKVCIEIVVIFYVYLCNIVVRFSIKLVIIVYEFRKL